MGKDFDNSNKNFNQHSRDFYNGYDYSKNSVKGKKFRVNHNGAHQRDENGETMDEIGVTFDIQQLDTGISPEERLEIFRKANKAIERVKKKKSGE